MMWHWNSLWAPAPGSPAVDDPTLWQFPVNPEQFIAFHARTWEAWLSASRSWWTMALSASPVATGWPLTGWASWLGADPAARTGSEPLTSTEPVDTADRTTPAHVATATRRRRPSRHAS